MCSPEQGLPAGHPAQRVTLPSVHADVDTLLSVWRWFIGLSSGAAQRRQVVVAAAPLVNAHVQAAVFPFAKPRPRGASSVCVSGHDFTDISTELLPRKPLPYEFLFYYSAKANIFRKDMRYFASNAVPRALSLSLSLSIFLLKKKV